MEWVPVPRRVRLLVAMWCGCTGRYAISLMLAVLCVAKMVAPPTAAGALFPPALYYLSTIVEGGLAVAILVPRTARLASVGVLILGVAGTAVGVIYKQYCG